MSSDLTQYGAKAVPDKEVATTKDSIRAVVDDISSRGQSDAIGITEFQVRHCDATPHTTCKRACLV
jgi:hypothetical protein